MKRKGTHDWWSLATPPLTEHAQIEKVYADLRAKAKEIGAPILFGSQGSRVMQPNLQNLPSRGRGESYEAFKSRKLWKAYGGQGSPPKHVKVALHDGQGSPLKHVKVVMHCHDEIMLEVDPNAVQALISTEEIEELWAKIQEMPLLSVKKREPR